MSNLTNFGSCGGEFFLQVIDNGDGSVDVLDTAVNDYATSFSQLGGKPTEIWLQVALTDSKVTAATLSPSGGSDSTTSSYRLIATITWNGDVPTITQGMRGSQNIVSCDATHQWGTLYN